MWRLVGAVKRSIGWRRKSSKVADESAAEGGRGDGHHETRNREGGPTGRLAAIFAAVHAPLAAVLCFAGEADDGSREFWASGEPARASEMDYLMVRDSMRYAIYV